jgi:hypothetical protein
MGLSVFSAGDGSIRERVDDGSVGAIDISRFRYPGLKEHCSANTRVELVETVDVGVPLQSVKV